MSSNTLPAPASDRLRVVFVGHIRQFDRTTTGVEVTLEDAISRLHRNVVAEHGDVTVDQAVARLRDALRSRPCPPPPAAPAPVPPGTHP